MDGTHPPTSDNTHHVDLVIVGAGLTGMALALAAGSIGLNAAVIERAPRAALLADTFDGRVTAIARGSKIMLDRLGAWQWLDANAQPINDIRVNEGYGIAQVHYDHREVGGEPLGWIAENRHIRQALLTAIDACPLIKILNGSTITEIDQTPNRAAATLADGTALAAPLLCLADGRHSYWRGQVGIDATVKAYGQFGLVATFAHEKPHHGVAVERFFPDGPFAMLPITGGRSSIVWALEERRAQRLAELDDAAFTAEVESRFGETLGALQLEGPRWSYPLSLVVTQAYSKGRVALVGDCAHGIHPIAGQGWNLALRDVAVLAEIIGERAAVGLDFGDVDALDHYSRWRRADGVALIGITDGINSLFANDISAIKMAREAGLSLVEQMTPAKQFFMRHAMGLTGDVPALLRL